MAVRKNKTETVEKETVDNNTEEKAVKKSLTLEEFKKFLKDTKFSTGLVEQMNQYFGIGNWGVNPRFTQFYGRAVVIQAETWFKLDDKNDDGTPIIVSMPGIGTSAMMPSYMESIERAQGNSILNSLTNLGAKNVEYDEPEPEEEEEKPAPKKSSPKKSSRKDEDEDEEDDEDSVECEECGAEITPYKAQSGRWMSVKQQVDMSTKNYDMALCRTCNGKRYKASQQSGSSKGRRKYGN
jgi:hypothetical protein